MIWLLGMAALAVVAAAIWDWLDPLEERDSIEAHHRFLEAIANRGSHDMGDVVGHGDARPMEEQCDTTDYWWQ